MPRNPLRSARRFRYSLRALLILTLLAGVAFAWVHRAHEQRAAVRALRDSNPGVTVIYERQSGARTADESRLRTWSRDHLGVDYVANVTGVQMSYATDADLERVARLPRLQRLCLFRSVDVTDAGMAHLADLKQLKTLLISEPERITDAGLRHLETLTSLELLTLSLGRARVSDQAIESLRRALPNCRIDVRTSSDDESHQLARN